MDRIRILFVDDRGNCKRGAEKCIDWEVKWI